MAVLKMDGMKLEVRPGKDVSFEGQEREYYYRWQHLTPVLQEAFTALHHKMAEVVALVKSPCIQEQLAILNGHGRQTVEPVSPGVKDQVQRLH